MLEHIKNILNIGRINVYPKFNTAKFTVGKVDLQEVLFPLILHHNLFFLTDVRRQQYNLCIYLLENNITQYSMISNYENINYIEILPVTSKKYTELPFFNNWLVGFTIAEGSFYIKTPPGQGVVESFSSH